MLSEGKISVQDAQKLLEALKANSSDEIRKPLDTKANDGHPPRYLRVVVDANDEGNEGNNG